MPDAVDMIMADHREVERLFELLKVQKDQRPLVMPTLAAMLTAHSRAEEAEVYPVARDDAAQSDQIAHSQEEHAKAEDLLGRLMDCDPQSADFDTVLHELVEAVKHHVEEEERTVLPGMRESLSDERRQQLGEAFALSRAKHLGEMPGEATREELVRQAQNLGMQGASSMSKEELRRRLAQ
ncbi:hemerythrin domain-containing protein [Nonomuraea sediminis]|uniref:hemerythrin domain-containing protein n=1 Tax=Nonomuraea sediminis TaxID=2835864 RepID=UPI001BDCF0CD|nr:hemerythrin domain-containing protein [Nonomuraea sediminis]